MMLPSSRHIDENECDATRRDDDAGRESRCRPRAASRRRQARLIKFSASRRPAAMSFGRALNAFRRSAARGTEEQRPRASRTPGVPYTLAHGYARHGPFTADRQRGS